MQQPLQPGAPIASGPKFYLVDPQPLRPLAVLLATVSVIAALTAFVYMMGETKHAQLRSDGSGPARSSESSSDDADDDPSQIDTIVLGDPADAPMPGHRKNHVSAVHPTIVIRLPRSGDQMGLIPDTSAGHLLYDWLAAFNQASSSALGNALPNAALASVSALP